jgi:hypothetical protein
MGDMLDDIESILGEVGPDGLTAAELAWIAEHGGTLVLDGDTWTINGGIGAR